MTADGVRNSTDPDCTTEAADLIAPEVVDVTFEYLTRRPASGWASWDGSLVGADGVTPTGPPRAIRVTFVLEFPGPAAGWSRSRCSTSSRSGPRSAPTSRRPRHGDDRPRHHAHGGDVHAIPPHRPSADFPTRLARAGDASHEPRWRIWPGTRTRDSARPRLDTAPGYALIAC